jgi:hypothetical protein
VRVQGINFLAALFLALLAHAAGQREQLGEDRLFVLVALRSCARCRAPRGPDRCGSCAAPYWRA